MPTLRCCLCMHMVCDTQEEIALVFPSSWGFSSDCSVVMFLNVILVIANWDGGLGEGAGEWDQMQPAQEGILR